MKREIVIGEHGCTAINDPLIFGLKHHTWSIAIFRWVTGKRGIKRGRTCYRVRGFSGLAVQDRDYYNRMVKRAKDLCKVFDKECPDWTPLIKSELVRG